ncbi:TrmB family transcriptional regulator [Halobacteria archaeon AArc-dxtr1]|nr:TrmB family transcriptional regulator [Halobacteria archaeon AArc-dxtr1]
MSQTAEAVNAMESLGLTEYESRCFVALTRLSKGTAKEVGRVADVPRSRVYDTVKRLEERGLVEVQRSEPQEYKAVPIDMATRRIREDYDSRVNAAENALQQVEEPESKDDEGMWAITQPDHVADRIVTFVDDAEETIHYLLADEEVVEQRTLDAVRRATDRDVDVVVEVPSDDLCDRVERGVPDAKIVVESDLGATNPVYSEWPGQLLMVDKGAIVAAGLKESGLPDVTQQMAMWTYGHDHGFAAWLRELLDDRLGRTDAGA